MARPKPYHSGVLSLPFKFLFPCLRRHLCHTLIWINSVSCLVALTVIGTDRNISTEVCSYHCVWETILWSCKCQSLSSFAKIGAFVHKYFWTNVEELFQLGIDEVKYACGRKKKKGKKSDLKFGHCLEWRIFLVTMIVGLLVWFRGVYYSVKSSAVWCSVYIGCGGVWG